MRLARKSAALTMLVFGCGTISACGQPEHPRAVSDFCLVDQRLTVEVAPGPGVDDPTNQFDTDETVRQALAHNEVHDRLC
jgi:hypothetical protein